MGTIGVDAYSHVIIETAELAAARKFYGDVLGVDCRPDAGWSGAGEAWVLPSGQFVVAVETASPRAFAETAAHVAYRAAPAAIDAIVARAGKAGVAVHRYAEDRPDEVKDNCYLADPDGNRIQLVAGDGPASGIGGIDHAAALCSDIEWEDDYWVEGLGVRAVHRVGWATQDFIRARAWGEGEEDMAPGTRRWDQRYRDIPGGKPGQGRKVARPNPQLFLDLGGDGRGPVLAYFLSQSHVQEPPPEAVQGTPRLALTVGDGAIDEIAAALSRSGARVEGPVVHGRGSALARSVYLRDRCGVFIEFCSRS